MSTSLLTFDGFPRADIDVAQIRTTRARINQLKTDHKALMSQLEVAIHEHFASGESLEPSTAASAPSATSASSSRTSAAPPVTQPAFAKINTVTEGSPAALAGLLAGDMLVLFGSANFANHERLSKVAQIVQQNENVSSVHAWCPQMADARLTMC